MCEPLIVPFGEPLIVPPLVGVPSPQSIVALLSVTPADCPVLVI